ncbi:hypothetical protein ONZ51_g11216 [Trametes cubensis]|uniref:Uncharacterized protein n=1 Tax=Trametes cubensis TaxID=1111947 RepID=A0AAD7X6I5_9APHY|nr:hypothetical protein ONZ51_g11216 [Trametes cubensis]
MSSPVSLETTIYRPPDVPSARQKRPRSNSMDDPDDGSADRSPLTTPSLGAQHTRSGLRARVRLRTVDPSEDTLVVADMPGSTSRVQQAIVTTDGSSGQEQGASPSTHASVVGDHEATDDDAMLLDAAAPSVLGPRASSQLNSHPTSGVVSAMGAVDGNTSLPSDPHAMADATGSSISDRPLLHTSNDAPQNRPSSPFPVRRPSSFSPIYLPLPLDGFPLIHHSDPFFLTRNLHPDQHRDWLNHRQSTSAALQIHGMGYPTVGRAQFITNGLRSALVAITGCRTVEVAAPIVGRDEQDRLHFPLPATYFAYNLTEAAASKLKAQICWSTDSISFFAYNFAPRIPEFLFTLRGFTKRDKLALMAIVQQTFLSTKYRMFTASLAVDNPRFRGCSTEGIIDTLLRSLEVKVVSGTDSEPLAVNVHCASPTTSPELWCLWRDILGAAQYRDSFCRQGFHRGDLVCTGCHGRDHERDGCPFSKLLGWKDSHLFQE